MIKTKKCTWRIFLSEEQSWVFWLDKPPAWSRTSFIMLSNTVTACHMNTWTQLFWHIMSSHFITRPCSLSIFNTMSAFYFMKLDLGCNYRHTNFYCWLKTPPEFDRTLTFGKILEKHSFSSSDKSICGRNISVTIFRTPVETHQSSIKIARCLYLQIVQRNTYVCNHPSSQTDGEKSAGSQG